MSQKNLHIALLVILLSVHGICGKVCSASSEILSRNETEHRGFSCPRTDEPSHLTECCTDEMGEPYCCGTLTSGFLGVNDRMLMAVSITVIIFCLISAVAIVLCCFYNKCPLYSACRVRYQNQNDIVAYTTKEEQMKLSEFGADEGSQQKYEPNSVTIRPVCDV